MLAIVIDLDRIRGDADAKAAVASSVAHIKASRTAPGHDAILLPGDPERRAAAKRGAEGVDIDDTSWRDITEAARAVGATEAEIAAAIG
jgi:uncharacterized oxidoreductase